MSTEPFSTRHLDYLQRTSIDIATLPSAPRLTAAPSELRRLWQIHAVGRLDKHATDNRQATTRPQSEDALIGLYGLKVPLAFLISGDKAGVGIRFGTWFSAARGQPAEGALDQRQEIIRAAIDSLYPAVEVTRASVDTPPAPLAGLVLGIPTAKQEDPFDLALPVDRLIRALSASTWACLVLAESVEESEIDSLRRSTINEMRSVKAGAQAERAPSPLADYYTELLNASLKSLTAGLAVGAWRTGVYLMGDAQSYYRLASVWKGIFSGDDSLPEPVRVWSSPAAPDLARDWILPDTEAARGPGYYRRSLEFQTILTSTQLAAYVHLPQLETSGFAIRTVPSFDATPPPVRGDRLLRLGSVILRTRLTETAYAVGLDDLTRHTFVAGVTGAGKTNTIFHMLKQTAASQVPFLVVEPAKTEYRALLDDPSLGGNLQVFTLGDELTSPFRLNPFEVVSWPAIPVGVHLDLLRSVFSASFGMWTPLPQVLEVCLHEIYKDRGWDVTSNTNYRLATGSDVADSFPTLSELAAKADEVIQRLGYEDKITDDLRAALLTRVNGLRTGGKGRMLDVQRSLPMDSLLGRSAVLELQQMGDDDDKAFVMGLLLIRLYEYRRAGNEVAGLVHLLVIEEAHRLLANVGAWVSKEEADPRGKAVEAFANLLSEIRAYGQGVIVADQIPVKLAPEVIKNTNLKIVHRLVAGDDRLVLAETMAMGDRQSRALVTLARGEAVVFSEGDDEPLLVKVPLAKDQGSQSPPDDQHVKDYMASFKAPDSYRTLFQPILPNVDMSLPAAYMAREAARALADDTSFRRDFVRLVVSMTEDDAALARLWDDVVTRAQIFLQPSMEKEIMLRCLIIYASRWFAHLRGAQAGWTYADTGEIEARLREVLLARLEGRSSPQALEALRTVMYRLHARSFEPFAGCATICTQTPSLCLYRRAVADLIARSEGSPADDWSAAYKDAGLPAVWSLCQDKAYELVEQNKALQATARRIGLCYAQHMRAAQFRELRLANLGGLIAESNRAGDGGKADD